MTLTCMLKNTWMTNYRASPSLPAKLAYGAIGWSNKMKNFLVARGSIAIKEWGGGVVVKTKYFAAFPIWPASAKE